MVRKVLTPVGLGARLILRVSLSHKMLFEHVDRGLVKLASLWGATSQFPAFSCMGFPTGFALLLVGVKLPLFLG